MGVAQKLKYKVALPDRLSIYLDKKATDEAFFRAKQRINWVKLKLLSKF